MSNLNWYSGDLGPPHQQMKAKEQAVATITEETSNSSPLISNPTPMIAAGHPQAIKVSCMMQVTKTGVTITNATWRMKDF